MRPLIILIMTVGSLMRAASAQLPQTRVFSVFPPGVTAGEIADLQINTGADLDEVERLVFDHPGVFATRKYQPDGAGGFKAVPNTFRVAVEEDVPVGRYELRAVGRFGISNPRTLIVDSRATAQDAEPNNEPSQAQRIALETLVDGQINGAGDLDVFRFSARQGQRVICDCLAERIDSPLNPTLTLSDADGRPVAFARNEYGRDSFLVYDIPADGEYLLEVRDETFTGSAEHIYRLKLHTGAHIRFVTPAAGTPGTTAQFTLHGYNLPGSRQSGGAERQALEELEVDIAIPAENEVTRGIPSVSAGLDFFPYRLVTDQVVSNRVLIGRARAPVSVEQDTGDNPASIQKLTPPFDLTGQLTRPAEVDRYEFDARKDQQLWIETVGQRHGAPIDLFVTVEQVTRGESGSEQTKTISSQDDTGTNLAPNVFDTATDDPSFLFKVPSDGTYRVVVQNRGAAAHPDPSRLYRLIICPPRPDFRLVAIPSGQQRGQVWPASLRRGDHLSLEVLAFRRDGFEGAIEVRAVDLSPGVSTRGTVIGEKENSAPLVVTASESAADVSARIRFVGSATIQSSDGERVIERHLRFGSPIASRSGNVPAISQLESELVLSIVPETAPYQVDYEPVVQTVYQGRQLLFPVSLQRRQFSEKLTIKWDQVAKKAKIDAPDLAFEKDQDHQTYRVFVRPDAQTGTHVIAGTAEAQVGYSRNPERATAAAVRKVLAEQEAERAKSHSDRLAARVSDHSKILEQASATVQQARAERSAAQKEVDESEEWLAAANAEVAAVEKQVQKLQLEVEELAAEANRNEGGEEPAGQESAASKKNDSETEQETLKTASDLLDKARQMQTEATSTLAEAREKMSAANAAVAEAEAVEAATKDRNAELLELARLALERSKTAEAQRAAAEKEAADATEAAKPKDMAFHQPLPPLILTVKPAPVALETSLSSAEVKAGESITVDVGVARKNEFAGPVRLSLAVPESVTGLSAPAVDVAADADSATLTVTASADAGEGAVPNLVIRAVTDAGGEAIVDAPLALKIVK